MNGISVVIATLNRVGVLKDTVNCILAQQFNQPYEIVIIDQSAEKNQEMAQLMECEPLKVKYYHISHFRGLPEARNYGVSRSTYDFILFIDDDIECDKYLLQAHYNVLKQNNVGIVAGGITEKFKANAGCETGKFHYFTAAPDRAFHIQGMKEVDHAGGGNFSIKKKVFVQSGGSDEYLNYGAALYEETDLCLRVKKLGYKIIFNYQAHLWHLGADTGGCRITDINHYVASLVHNRALLIGRHLKWYHKPVAFTYLVRLVLAYSLSYRNLHLCSTFLSVFNQGYKEGKLSPKNSCINL